jgi:ferredoxin-NADP reductase
MTTERPVRLLYANRDVDSVIFRAELDALHAAHPERLEVVHHLDTEHGFVHSNGVAEFAGAALDADFYICGPGPFMDVVEDALSLAHVPAEQVFIERFAFAATARLDEPPATPANGVPEAGATETVVIVLNGREHQVHYQAGETFLETARRAGLRAPFSCEAGSCATCMAHLEEGEATMRVNNALTPGEVAEGWVLTCQGFPASPAVKVVYES